MIQGNFSIGTVVVYDCDLTEHAAVLLSPRTLLIDIMETFRADCGPMLDWADPYRDMVSSYFTNQKGTLIRTPFSRGGAIVISQRLYNELLHHGDVGEGEPESWVVDNLNRKKVRHD